MKRLYARLVLWLIRPALEMNDVDRQVAITQAIRLATDRAKDRAKEEILTSMQRGGVFCQVRADRDRLSEILRERSVKPPQEAVDREGPA